MRIKSLRSFPPFKHKRDSRRHFLEDLKTIQIVGDDFPLNQLRQYVDDFLGNLKIVPQSAECDRTLMALVREHTSPDVATLACLHAISVRAGRQLLRTSLRVDSCNHPDVRRYLCVLRIASEAYPNNFSPPEAKCIVALNELSVPEAYSVGPSFQSYVEHLGQIPDGRIELFLDPAIWNAIPQRVCVQFADRLERLRDDSKWLQAYEESSWLADVRTSDTPALINIFRRGFPMFNSWAAWRPDVGRLKRWDLLNDDQRQLLKPVLALEGPDFTGNGHPTLKAHLTSQRTPTPHVIDHEGLCIESIGEATRHEFLNRLLVLLDSAAHIGGRAVEMFSHYCIDPKTDPATLDTVEAIFEGGNSSTCGATLDLLNSDTSTNRMLTSLAQLLRFLDGHENLRHMFCDRVWEVTEPVVRRAQEVLRTQLQRGGPGDSMGMRIYNLGAVIQRTTWVYSRLSDDIRSLIDKLPPIEDLEMVFRMRCESRQYGQQESSRAYLMAVLLGEGRVNAVFEEIVKALTVHHHQPTSDTNQDVVAIALSNDSDLDSQLRRQCLSRLHEMDARFVRKLATIKSYQDKGSACVSLTSLLVPYLSTRESKNQCWKRLLFTMIEQSGSTLPNLLLQQLNLEEWFNLISDLSSIFHGDDTQTTSRSVRVYPSLLQRSLLDWTAQLVGYLPVLKRLEGPSDEKKDLRWILLKESSSVRKFLDTLAGCQQPHRMLIIDCIVSKLSPDGSNAVWVCETVSSVTCMSEQVISICLRVVGRCQSSQREAAESILTGWRETSELSTADKMVLRDFAKVFDLRLETTKSSLKTTMDILGVEYDSFLDRARSVESKRLALKLHDARATSTLLTSLGIENHSATEYASSEIPKSLLDVVEKIDDREYELSFPLTHVRPFQRKALGIGMSVRMLILRLSLRGGRRSPAFCLHLHPETSVALTEHQLWRVVKGCFPPDKHTCTGDSNRAIYQLYRIISQHLLRGFQSLEIIYRTLGSAIDHLGHVCLVCGSAANPTAWRSTTCTKPCSLALRRSPLEVRLIDLYQDPAVVDALLASVYAAACAQSERMDLVPGCPVPEGQLTAVLDSFPPMSNFRNTLNFSISVQQLGWQHERLLSWICTSYRGFMTTAPNQLRVPSMPGVYQFILVNAAPELESAFSRHVKNSGSNAVFHGTTIDRLYRILTEGLRIQSGTEYMANGAMSGNGIYLANEPSTSWRFTNSQNTSWTASAYHNRRVLLGCELAGSSVSNNGTYVVQDASRIMVRYVFLCPANFQVPLARHVTPAMQSAFASLRSGSV